MALWGHRICESGGRAHLDAFSVEVRSLLFFILQIDYTGCFDAMMCDGVSLASISVFPPTNQLVFRPRPVVAGHFEQWLIVTRPWLADCLEQSPQFLSFIIIIISSLAFSLLLKFVLSRDFITALLLREVTRSLTHTHTHTHILDTPSREGVGSASATRSGSILLDLLTRGMKSMRAACSEPVLEDQERGMRWRLKLLFLLSASSAVAKACRASSSSQLPVWRQRFHKRSASPCASAAPCWWEEAPHASPSFYWWRKKD